MTEKAEIKQRVKEIKTTLNDICKVYKDMTEEDKETIKNCMSLIEEVYYRHIYNEIPLFS